MRKWVAVLLMISLVLSFCACGKSVEVRTVEKLIKQIGPVTLEKEVAIQEATSAYDLLSTEDKDAVENYDQLASAATALLELKEVKFVEDAISQIGDVTLESEKEIIDAETAYAELPVNLKSQISNYDVLLEARTVYDAIPKVVDLTVGNFSEYLTIERTTEKTDYTYGAVVLRTKYEDFFIIRPIQEGKFEDVEFTMDLVITYVTDAPEDFAVEQYESYEESIDDNGDYVYIYTMKPLKISENGTAEAMYYFFDDSGILRWDYSYELTAISGTFTEY